MPFLLAAAIRLFFIIAHVHANYLMDPSTKKFSIGDSTFCPPNYVSNRSEKKDTVSWRATLDSALSPALDTDMCELAECDGAKNKRVLASSDLSSPEHACVCKPGYRIAKNGDCILCSKDRICLGTDSGKFRCPDHSTKVSLIPQSTSLITTKPYCIAEKGYVLAPNTFSDYHFRIFTKDSSFNLFVARQSEAERCGAFEEIVDGVCTCMDGFYRQGAQQCQQCPAGFFCTASQKQKCPSGKTSNAQSSKDIHCDITKCPPGEYLAQGLSICKVCKVGFFCLENQMHACPAYASTLYANSSSVHQCRCLTGFAWDAAPNSPRGFVCVLQNNRVLSESLSLSVAASSVDFHDALAWTNADADVGLIGAIVRLNNQESRMEVIVVQDETFHRKEMCNVNEIVSNQDMFNCTLDQLHGAAEASGTSFVLKLHVFMLCHSTQYPYDVSLFAPIKVSATASGITCSAASSLFEQTESATLHTFRIAESASFLQVEVQRRDFVEQYFANSSFIDQALIENIQGSDDDANIEIKSRFVSNFRTVHNQTAWFQATCHGLHLTAASPRFYSAQPFVPNVTVSSSGQSACFETPTKPSTQVIQVSEDTQTIDIETKTFTVLRWSGFDKIDLQSDPSTAQTVYDLKTKFDSCYDAEISYYLLGTKQKLQEISRLDGKEMMVRYYPIFPDLFGPDGRISHDDSNYVEKFRSWGFEKVQEKMGQGEEYVSLAITLEHRGRNITISEPLALIQKLEPAILATLQQSLLTQLVDSFYICLNVGNETSRFGETELTTTGKPRNIQVARGDGATKRNVTISIVDKTPTETELFCFDLHTCTREIAARSSESHHKKTASHDWHMGSGSGRFLAERMLGAKRHWVVVKTKSHECPENSSPNGRADGCVCNDGYKALRNQLEFACTRCSPREKCEASQLPVICNITDKDQSTARCACPDGYKYHSPGRCIECDPFSVCVAGVATVCGDKMRISLETDNVCICLQGYHMSPATQSCFPCPVGFFCQDGTAVKCDPGKTTKNTHSVHSTRCVCAAGHEKDTTTNQCRKCPQGFYKDIVGEEQGCLPCAQDENKKTTFRLGATSEQECSCDDGFLAVGESCVKCHDEWNVCNNGRITTCLENEIPDEQNGKCLCTDGFFRNRQQECSPCPRGSFCSKDSLTSCPRGMTSRQGIGRESDCYCQKSDHIEYVHDGKRICACPPASYQNGDDCVPCPENSIRKMASGTPESGQDSCTCKPGFYLAGDRRCRPCEQGYYCPGNHTSQQRFPCPDNMFSIFHSLHTPTGCIKCDNGETIGTGNAAPFAHSPLFCHRKYLPLSLEYADSTGYPPLSFREHDNAVVYEINPSDCTDVKHNLDSKIGIMQVGEGDVCKWTHDGSFLTYASTILMQDKYHALFVQVATFLGHKNQASDILMDYAFCFLVAIRSGSGGCALFRSLSTDERHIKDMAKQIARACLHDEDKDVSVVGSSAASPANNMYKMLARFFLLHAHHLALPTTNEFIAEHILPVQVDYTESNVVALFALSNNGSKILGMIQDYTNRNELSFELNAFTNAKTQREKDTMCFTPIMNNPQSQTSLLACASTVSVLNQENVYSVFCEFCAPGTEFRDPQTGKCLPCTTGCKNGVQTPCCGSSDTMCNPILSDGELSTQSSQRERACGNGVIDIQFFEDCDWRSNTTNCCTLDCKFLPGYYTTTCKTFCGDNIVAGLEECDSDLDPLCNPSTCQCYKYRGVHFDADSQRCRLF
tara:strand:- start:11671 stop:16884 length:5214 start_codon:yes stop_codon:yes gene_type:complete